LLAGWPGWPLNGPALFLAGRLLTFVLTLEFVTKNLVLK